MEETVELIYDTEDGKTFRHLLKTEPNGRLLVSKVQMYFPGTVGLRYKEKKKWIDVGEDNTGVFYRPKKGWANKKLHCLRENSAFVQGAVSVQRSSNITIQTKDNFEQYTVPPGEEKLKTIEKFEEVEGKLKVYDLSSKAKIDHPPPKTSSVFSEFFPLEKTTNFAFLYGDLFSQHEKDPITKLIQKLSAVEKTSSEALRRTTSPKSPTKSRHGSPSRRSKSRRRRSRSRSSRRGRSRSRRRPSRSNKETTPPGSDEIEVILETTPNSDEMDSRNRDEDNRRSRRDEDRDRIRDPDRRRRRDLSRERRDLSRERRRNQEERRLYEDERRRIRDERHRLEDLRKEREDQSAWLQKSDDFLKKLGIPSQPEAGRVEASLYRRRENYPEERSSRTARRYSPDTDYDGRRRHDERSRKYSATVDVEDLVSDVLSYSYTAHREGSSFSRASTHSDSRVSKEVLYEDDNVFSSRKSSPPSSRHLSDEYQRFSELIRTQPMNISPERGQWAQSGPVNYFGSRPEAVGRTQANLGADIDLRGSTSQATQNRDELRPGNYIMVVFDMITLGMGIKSDPYQIGAISTLGDTFLRCIQPKNQKYAAEVSTNMPMVMFKKKYHLNNRTTGTMEPCHPEENAFKDFIDYLEKCKQRTRPAFDGVVLVCKNLASIAPFIKYVKRMGLEAQLWKQVSSIGSMCRYMERLGINDPRMRKLVKNNEVMNIPMDDLYYSLFHQRISLSSIFSDLKANYCYQILLKLMNEMANYANFFRDFTYPNGSKNLNLLLRPTNTQERLEMYNPLRAFFTRTLRAQQADELEDEDSVGRDRPSPEESANRMCYSLLEAGFDFDELLEMAKVGGLSEMELNLRTILLHKMAGQSRSVVNNAIQTTKLVVGFFLQNGHKSLEDLLKEYEGESPEADDAPQARLALSEREKNDYEQLRRFICNKVFTSTVIAERNIRTQQFIEVLNGCGFTVSNLQSLFIDLGRNLDTFMKQLKEAIGDRYCSAGPVQVSLTHFVGYIAEYLTSVLAMDAEETVATKLTPTWYRCRNCEQTGTHLYDNCFAPIFCSNVGDERYLLELNETFVSSANSDAYYQSLLPLRNYLETRFSSVCFDVSGRLCTLAAESVVLALASLHIPGKHLFACSEMSREKINHMLFNRFSHEYKFAKLIDLPALKNLIIDFIASL